MQQIQTMLIDVVEDGTETKAKIPLFTIAGKTSTTQRPDKLGGYTGYIPGFVGFPVGVERPALLSMPTWITRGKISITEI